MHVLWRGGAHAGFRVGKPNAQGWREEVQPKKLLPTRSPPLAAPMRLGEAACRGAVGSNGSKPKVSADDLTSASFGQGPRCARAMHPSTTHQR